MQKVKMLFLIFALVVLTVFGCGGNQKNEETKSQEAAPEIQNQDAEKTVDTEAALDAQLLIETRCISCHTLDRVYIERPTGQWPNIVSRMVSKSPGLLDEAEFEVVVEYLQKNYGR